MTAIEAITLGHNYIGCEHLPLGLISETDGTAGDILRELGIDLRTTRQTVVAALTGYTHCRAQSDTTQANAATMIATAIQQQLRPVVDRLDRLEQQAGLCSER